MTELEIFQAYEQSLNDHIRFVREAGRMIGVAESQLRAHDLSKWSDEEFTAYAMNFHGKGSPVDAAVISENFARAWLHHIHNNPHHWQHWIFADGYTPNGSNIEAGVMAMPEPYALEMIADWMGAGRAYTGSWDMTDWLTKNLPRIRLHSTTRLYVYSVLSDLGYSATLPAGET